MNIQEAAQRVKELTRPMTHEQHALVDPYLADIEAFGKVILAAIGDNENDESAIIGGFQTLFLYAYLRGRADAQGRQR